MDCKYQLKDGCMRISMPKELDQHRAEELRSETNMIIEAYHISRLVCELGRKEVRDS